jgi:hypothetical protein
MRLRGKSGRVRFKPSPDPQVEPDGAARMGPTRTVIASCDRGQHARRWPQPPVQA